MLQSNGTPVPPSFFTAPNTTELIQQVTGTVPINVEVVTDQEAVIELDESVLAVGIAQQMQGSLVWGRYATKVTCLLSSRDSVISVVRDRETARERLKALEEE